MLESFKKFFRNAKEINNDPFFDKLETKKVIEKSRKEMKNEIPIDSLVAAISKHGICSCFLKSEYYKAYIQINKTKILHVEIDSYNSHVKLEEWLEDFAVFETIFSFQLKKEEIDILKTTIKQKVEKEKIEKDKNSRQGIENVLQGILK